MNQNNNNDLYHEDNSFNNQGIDMPKDEPTTGESLSDMVNSGMNFAKGINNIKNNPALGLKKPKEEGKESDKKDGNNKNNQNNNDPAKGQKDKKDNNNQMPGAKKNDDSKKPNAKNDSNNKNKSGDNNIGNKNKPNGMFSRFNPMNKNKPGKSGNSKKTPGTTAPNLNQMAKKGLRTAWTAAPIQVKLIVIGVAIVPILIIGFIALLSIFGATVAATTAAMCGVDSFGSSYNGADYTGSADRKEFLCKMQNPLGKKTNYVITGVAGENRGYAHAGIDLAISKGTPIYAAQSGTVVSVHDGCTVENQRYNPCGGGYGNHVKIKHGDAFYTLYAHMVNGSVKVKKGDKVGKGQLIGQVGSTGRSTGPHLHLELRTSSDTVIYDHNQYFKNIESFKANCGSMWEGDPTGDSANAENDTTDYVSSGGLSSSECCGSGSSSSEPVEGLPKAITQEFVDAAVSTQTKYKVPASLTLAQLILESGAHSNSLSELAVKCKNLFGVKGSGPAGSCNYLTSEQTSSGNSYNIYANFAKYNTYQESFDARGELLTGSYYQRCVKDAKTGDEWARAVKECGYATDVKYDEKLISIMKQYDLYKYDDYTSSDSCLTTFDGEIVFYDQTDYPHVKFCSGSCNVARSGCGATAMAIVLSSLLKKEITPVEMAEFCCSRKLCGCSGSGDRFFQAVAKDYGVNIKRLSRDNKEEVLTALNRKQGLVIAVMGPGRFTNGGHFITLTGIKGDQVFVHDPNNGDKRGTNKYWDFDFIVKQTRQDINNVFWIITR